MTEVRVVGQNALARELREERRAAPLPVVLVADPDHFAEAVREAPEESVVAVTALSPGGGALARRLSLGRPVATFGALPPLSEARLTEVSLPPSLLKETRKSWLEALEAALGPVREVEEGPGLVVPRILSTLANEAAFLLGEGGARAGDIDLAMMRGVNYPRGPLRWADLIGLDLIEGCLLALSEAYGAERYRPAPALRRLVAAGKTGAAAGEGFFVYRTSEEDGA